MTDDTASVRAPDQVPRSKGLEDKLRDANKDGPALFEEPRTARSTAIRSCRGRHRGRALIREVGY